MSDVEMIALAGSLARRRRDLRLLLGADLYAARMRELRPIIADYQADVGLDSPLSAAVDLAKAVRAHGPVVVSSVLVAALEIVLDKRGVASAEG